MKFKNFKSYQILLVTILAFLLSGCSILFDEESDSGINTGDQTVESEHTTKLIWWGMFETSENVEPLIESFMVENPDVEIEYIEKDKETYQLDLNTVLEGDPNTVPDIFMVHNSWVGNYSSYISNAPDLVYSSSDFEGDMHEFVSADFNPDGAVKGVPLWVDMLALVYNEDHLVESGDTVLASDWNGFQVQAENMTIIDNQDELVRPGFSAGRSTNVEFYFDVINLLFMQTRDLPLDEDSKFLPFRDDEISKATDAITFYKSFLGSNQTWDRDSKLDTARFIEGDLSSIILPSWRVLDILEFKQAGNLDLNFRIVEVPQLNTAEDAKVNWPTYWGYSVSKETDNMSTAWEFLKHIGEKDQQELYKTTVEGNGRPFSLISPRKDMLNDFTDQNLEAYVESIPYTKNWNMTNGDKLKPDFIAVLDSSASVEDILETARDIRENETVL